MPLSEVQEKLDEARDIIRQEFGYTHITLQAEIDRCADPSTDTSARKLNIIYPQDDYI